MENDIRLRETLRYLGYGGAEPDERTLELVNTAQELLLQAARPRAVWRTVDICVSQNTVHVDSTGDTICFNSESLGRALSGCSQMVCFGATLGIEVDMLIRKESRRNISLGAVLQAAATTMIEEYCDEKQEEIGKMLAEDGHTLGDRFSPGYADFELVHQQDIFRLLDCPRKIGLTLSDSLLMVPSKSVTAVMAVDGGCGRQLGCEYCNKKDCMYRRIKK